ncbi:hypothetical protein QTG54_001967 [Skeletonema marinoi]|uniref:DUF7733 domain-containing protein n=1 Tax=Skeletonema marinoi TaxID=267567 RepID=A0AAD9DJ30_9STRA|nr:hypothetical protein QTG54_001967 [Skeletonema marinoi]
MMQYSLLLVCCPISVVAFSPPATTATLKVVYPCGHTSTTAICAYGKGSEIWPECNEEPIGLSASFPGGKIPPAVVDLLESESSATSTNNPDSTITATFDVNNQQIKTTGRKRRAVRKTLSHILKSAAKASSRRAASETMTAIDRTPAVLAALLIGTKCVSLKPLVFVLAISAYFIGLASWCAAPKSSGTVSIKKISDVHSASDMHSYDYVNMPSLPEKGHVPNLVANPLGLSLTTSRIYRLWLRLGATLGLLLPTLALALSIVGSNYPSIGVGAVIENAEHVRRSLGDPLFLLCFQAITEAVSRAALLPLPMRILVPVVYNTVRLSPLHAWAFPALGSSIPTSLRILGISNLLYWYANLLLFLIPVGVVRYMRAHFFCVEAVEVTVRKGGDASVGLLP